MKSLTVIYTTSRPEPELAWFLDSLNAQVKGQANVIVVDFHGGAPRQHRYGKLFLKFVAPKPTVWQGQHRLTQADWWAASNARNTGICLAQTDWIAFIDDRSVLAPTWSAAVYDAMAGEYVVCGPYQKRHSVTVEQGVIKNAGIVTGDDSRLEYVRRFWSDPRHQLSNPYSCPGEWTYGCSIALPLDWALKVNGFDETCDGLSMEDSIFGIMCANNGFPIRFDTRMALIEDRTPAHLGPAMIRKDKGESPNDKSHALLEMLRGKSRAAHVWNLEGIRASLANGGSFPIPTLPVQDWYDGEPLNQMQP